ncbi:hypothetical protein LCGC14_0961690 [marine sediment metagenome]|uniref:Disease resistance R13L4/SHOC-2-like LRR domain-containing protein n=1 Tax=marine sediment metagenome TaxID=412755 RepID=A0A0F9NJ02_9ZZZZ|nr:leucine-rich repeat domain-containing protein [archaeon]
MDKYKIAEREFKVNEFLELKLENEKTVIYVASKPIRNCKFLLINIPINNVSDFDEIQSIDQAAENLDRSLEPLRGRKQFKYRIPPDVEFWGHCSNLQVWYENGYNTKLLHVNLAFPLLKALTKAGDDQANKVFKEEIANRYNSGVDSVREYLLRRGYLDYLSLDELLSLIENECDLEVLMRLRKEYPRFERRESGEVFRLNIGIKNGRLVKLDLANSRLEILPNYLLKLASLEELRISYNEIKTLPNWIGGFSSLKVFDATSNFLTTIPDEIGKLKNLQKLVICSNQIERLPESIGNIKSLNVLDVHQNSLQSIPESIGNLTNLEKLDLSENSIISLPDSIGKLKKLRDFNLSTNLLILLPNSIGELKSLQNLLVGENRLHNLPSSLRRLQKLKILSISKNQIVRFPLFLYELSELDEIFIRGMAEIKSQIKMVLFKRDNVTIYSD